MAGIHRRGSGVKRLGPGARRFESIPPGQTSRTWAITFRLHVFQLSPVMRADFSEHAVAFGSFRPAPRDTASFIWLRSFLCLRFKNTPTIISSLSDAARCPLHLVWWNFWRVHLRELDAGADLLRIFDPGRTPAATVRIVVVCNLDYWTACAWVCVVHLKQLHLNWLVLRHHYDVVVIQKQIGRAHV